MAQSRPGGGSFASGLLARFNNATKAAQETSRRALVQQAELKRQENAKKEEEKKRRYRKEADKIIERNVPKMTRRKFAAASKPRDRQKAVRIKSPIRKPRPHRAGPQKPLPGMEFVVRKTQRKNIKVPHSSDYSDMFGEQYLIGVDLDVTKQMAKKTAEAAKENVVILREKEERRKLKVKEAEEITRKENELRAKGLLTAKQKRKIRCEASAKDWVAVDAPAPVGSRVKDLATRPLAANSGPRVRSEKEAKKLEMQVTQRDVELRKRRLREKVLAMSGGSSAKASKKRGREDVVDRVAPKRSRRSYGDVDDVPARTRVERRGRRHEPPKREERAYSRERGYNSEEWSDNDDDDDDDEEDLYGIEALEREEEESRRIAEHEDKMERKKEIRRKKEKERRRREFEDRHGY